MSNYVETYIINGTINGIEDLASPGQHHVEGRKRFVIWHGGCVIGDRDTLEDARIKLHDYITTKIFLGVEALKRSLENQEKILADLGNEERNLVRFQRDCDLISRI